LLRLSVKAACAAGFPRRVGKVIDEAKRYAESTAIRIEVQAPEDIEIVASFAGIKLAN
jgi:hypothetical protein